MALQSLLLHQAGVVSRRQAIGAGLTQDTVDRLLRLRRWRPLHPGVYLAAGHRLDDEARVRAAVVWAGPGALLSGAAAAWWHGLGPGDGSVPETVTLRAPRPLRPPPGIVAHDHSPDSADRAVHRGLAVTGPALSVLEAAVELGAAGEAYLREAVRGGIDLAALRAAHRRNLDAPGATRMTRLLDALTGCPDDRGADVIFDTAVRRPGAPGGPPPSPADRPVRPWRPSNPCSAPLVEAAAWNRSSAGVRRQERGR